jgi:hypothetical protein
MRDFLPELRGTVVWVDHQRIRGLAGVLGCLAPPPKLLQHKKCLVE